MCAVIVAAFPLAVPLFFPGFPGLLRGLMWCCVLQQHTGAFVTPRPEFLR